MEKFSFGLLILIISFIYIWPFRHLPLKKSIKVILYALLPIIFLFVSGLYLAEVKNNLSCFIILIIYLFSYFPYAQYLEKLLKIKNINYYLLCSFLYLSLLATLIIGFWQNN